VVSEAEGGGVIAGVWGVAGKMNAGPTHREGRLSFRAEPRSGGVEESRFSW
jgi:hypothetical protein